jgi:hypothetical protein
MVPILGDLFDFGWQANIRNTRILRQELEQKLRIEKAALLPETPDQSGF